MNYFTKDKPYNSLNEYYLKKYGFKVAKIPLNLNFSCPNKDGLKGYGGCIYCSKMASGDIQDYHNDLKTQYNKLKELQLNKWKNIKFMPYLQAGTNTYADTSILKEIYNNALNLDEDLFGLSIATRPDSITEDTYELLNELNKKTHLQIELGFQTANEETSKFINRGLTNLEFENCVNRLINNNIEVVVHIINGLPYETYDDMINTIKYLNQFKISGIKIHMLLVLEDTKLYDIYKSKPFHLLTLDEYVKIVCDQISYLNDNVIIHRLSSDSPIDGFMPKWPKKKIIVMNMRKNNLFQGKYIK